MFPMEQSSLPVSTLHSGDAAPAIAENGSSGNPDEPASGVDSQPRLVPELHRRRHRPTPPCRFYRRGFCRYGDSCRFLHSSATEPATTAASTPRSTSLNDAVEEEESEAPLCQNWLRGNCRRGSRCRFSHPPSVGRLGGFEYMASQFIERMLVGDLDDEAEQRMRNGGFTDDDVYELSLQGIKPWDEEAWDALAVLNGMDI